MSKSTSHSVKVSKSALKSQGNENFERETFSRAVKKQNVSKSSKSNRQRRRIKVAAVLMVICSCGLLLLGFQDAQENQAKEVGALEHILSDTSLPSTDPLMLSSTVNGLEFLGSSENNNTLGYMSDQPAKQMIVLIVAALQTGGWILDHNQQAGLISMYKQESSQSQSTYLLIQYIDVSGGSSIVVRQW